jgi:hypothetical protein
MRKLLLATTAAMILAGASSASATVTVFATIDKTKDVTVTETLTVVKFVFLDVVVVSTPEKFAEGDALVNQFNNTNTGCFNCAEKIDTIDAAGNNNAGIFNINQSSGNMNNQGTAVAVAVDTRVITTNPPAPGDPLPTDLGFAEAQAGAEQVNQDSIDKATALFFKNGVILASLNNNTGILNANQAPGNMNNQANSISMSVSFAPGGVALSEADLGQFNLGNKVFESATAADNVANPGFGINKSAAITGSITGNSGIVGVNQAVGTFANQANVVAFAAVILK